MEYAIVVAILGGLFLFLYPAMQRAKNPKGPYGKVYPAIPPSEDRRITHPTGLSIIAPVNWDQIRDFGPTVPSLSVARRGYPGARLRSYITIRDCDPPMENELAGFRKVRFGQHAAFENMEVTPTNSDRGLSTYDLYVETPGQWWHVMFCVAEKTTNLSPSIRQYIETIQFPDEQTANQ